MVLTLYNKLKQIQIHCSKGYSMNLLDYKYWARFIYFIGIGALLSACATSQLDRKTANYSDAVYNTLLAEFSLRNHDDEEAAAYFAKAYTQSPEADFIIRIIEVSLRSGNYFTAMRASEDLLKYHPEHPVVAKLLPYLYFNHGQASRAIKLLEAQQGSKIFDDVFLKIAAVGLFNENEENYKGLRQAAEYFPNSAYAQFAYAIAAERAQEPEDVLVFAERGIKQKPDLDTGYRLKASALNKLDRLNESYLALKKGLKRTPDSKVLRWELAKTLNKMENYSGAYEEYFRLFQSVQNSMQEPPFELIQELGLVTMKLNDADQALQYFERLKEYPGLHLRANYLIAHVLYQKKNWVEAIKLLQGIQSGNSIFQEAQLLIVRIYREQNQMDAALEQLNKAIETLGDSDENTQINFYIAQGEILRDAKRYRDAYAVYSKAINAFPGQFVFRTLRAYNASSMDDIETLEIDAEFVLNNDPNNVDMLNLIGYYFADKNIHLDKAKIYLERAYELAPNDPRIIDSVGWLEFRLNNLERAKQLIREALELYPDPEIHGHLIEILRTQQQFDEADKHLHEALGMYPDDEYLNSL